MGLRNWWSKVQGAPHVAGGAGDDPGEVAAALHEDYSPSQPAESELEEIQKDQLTDDLAAAPVAETPYATAGESRAAEIEVGLEADVEPQEDEGPLNQES